MKPSQGQGFYLFRKSITLQKKPLARLLAEVTLMDWPVIK
jgi:hypothetical protein